MMVGRQDYYLPFFLVLAEGLAFAGALSPSPVDLPLPPAELSAVGVLLLDESLALVELPPDGVLALEEAVEAAESFLAACL